MPTTRTVDDDSIRRARVGQRFGPDGGISGTTPPASTTVDGCESHDFSFGPTRATEVCRADVTTTNAQPPRGAERRFGADNAEAGSPRPASL